MNSSQPISYGFMLVIIVLVFWLRSRRNAKARPIRRNGYGMLIPVVVLLFVFGAAISSFANNPDQPFHAPAAWEILVACLMGVVFGGVMLYHTRYEKREDGQVYSRPNKYFQYTLLAIVVIRIALSQFFQTLDPADFAVLMMTMAYIYISIWRIGSFVKFRLIRAN